MSEQVGTHVLTALKKAFQSGEYSDLLITCGDHQHKVHRVLVCLSSEVFAAAVRFPGKECQEDRIDLPEDDPAVVELLMQYIYEGDYDPKLSSRSKEDVFKDYITDNNTTCKLPHTCVPSAPYRGHTNPCDSRSPCPHHTCGVDCSNCRNFVCDKCLASAKAYEYGRSAATSHDLLTHTKMYEIGEKYAVTGLKDLAQRKFGMACNLFWNDDVFPQAASHVHRSTVEIDQGLRSIVHKTICEHIELIKKEEIKALMKAFNLTMAVLLKLAEEYEWRSVSSK